MLAMRFRPASLLCALLLASAGTLVVVGRMAIASPQDTSAMPGASAVVKPHAYVSLDPVPRGSEFQVAVVVDIARGFHMNSHKPTDTYLIPTTITPQLPAGMQLGEAIYPSGRLQKFSFSPTKPLDVYTGSVALRLRLSARDDAPLGPTTIPVTLRYQACNDAACLPPVRVPVTVLLQVAATGTKPRVVHPEIFQATSPR
jgi:DsbC/DsbD-like thiol-disulfide interchange protein